MDRERATNALPAQLTLFGASTAADAALAVPQRLAQLAGRIVEYRFARTRRRTIGISIDAHGLQVTAPRAAPWRDIESFLQEKARWIVARLDEWAGVPPLHIIHGVSGETFPFFGAPMELVASTGPGSVRREGARVIVSHREHGNHVQVLCLLVDWLKAQALASFAPRAAHYAALLGRAAPRVKLSRARSQWGVCTEGGLIRLNWRLVHLEPALSDYVVAHETAHLVELNHSKRFWNLVGTLYPHWRDARERLELAGASLPVMRGAK